MFRRNLQIGSLLGCLLLFPALVFAGERDPLRDTLKMKRSRQFYAPFQWGVYAGWNTNENYEFGLSIPLRNDSKFLPGKTPLSKELPESNIVVSTSGFNMFNSNVERMYNPRPFPLRISVQAGLEKAVVSSVYRPSFGFTVTPFSLWGYMTKRSTISFRYLINHILLDGSYLPSVNNYNDTWKVGGGVMWRIPFRHLAYDEHMSFRLMVNYHYRIEENNPFRHDEFTFTLNVTLHEYQTKYGYRISNLF